MNVVKLEGPEQKLKAYCNQFDDRESTLDGIMIRNIEFTFKSADDNINDVLTNFEALEKYLTENTDFKFKSKYDKSKDPVLLTPTIYKCFGTFTIEFPKFMEFDESSFTTGQNIFNITFDVYEPNEIYIERLYKFMTEGIDSDYIKDKISREVWCCRDNKQSLVNLYHRYRCFRSNNMWFENRNQLDILGEIVSRRQKTSSEYMRNAEFRFKSFEETDDCYRLTFDVSINEDVPWWFQLFPEAIPR